LFAGEVGRSVLRCGIRHWVPRWGNWVREKCTSVRNGGGRLKEGRSVVPRCALHFGLRQSGAGLRPGFLWHA
jgi:hypothetical protein